MPVLPVNADRCTADDLAAAAAWLRDGGVVAFPTDTLYGLAVDPRSAPAVSRLFGLKGRDERSPIPLIAGSLAQVEAFCGPLNEAGRRLAAAFWPGPLAIVCLAPQAIAPAVHAGTGTVAIRVPDHAIARALADACGTPVTATSANRSGAPPVSRADAIDLPLERVFVIDGGATRGGPPSTIVDARDARVRLVREGAIAWNRVLESLQR